MTTQRSTFAIFCATFCATLGVVLATLAGLAVPAVAREPAVFTDIIKGVGAGGYDVVAYFAAAKPVVGKAEFKHDYNGAVWRFDTVANLEAFKADPAKYAPQFGGYCAWAVSQGYTAKGDPSAWTIVDGKLYLNYNAAVRKNWEENKAANISKANAQWPTVLDKPRR
jgi:YHS domain-containing protein